MTWTTDKPTVENGAFWVRLPNDRDPFLVRFIDGTCWSADSPVHSDAPWMKGAEWYGPLQPPPEDGELAYLMKRMRATAEDHERYEQGGGASEILWLALDALEARCDDARNAARYRWFKENATTGSIGFDFRWWIDAREMEELDAAIDKELAAKLTAP